jgi:hypothetical protein
LPYEKRKTQRLRKGVFNQKTGGKEALDDLTRISQKKRKEIQI